MLAIFQWRLHLANLTEEEVTEGREKGNGKKMGGERALEGRFERERGLLGGRKRRREREKEPCVKREGTEERE